MIGTVGYPTSYLGMFKSADNGRPSVTAVEIPMIQRDYAQGRTDPTTTTIRRHFLRAVMSAIKTDAPLGLDFVYGELSDSGVFRPLDGQQRLTTLFLLHWYVASVTESLEQNAPWLRFTYATRPSAQHFTEALAEHPLPSGVEPSAWIEDQTWYLYPWRTDPTVQSMLVMLHEIHSQLAEAEVAPRDAWARLSRRDDPVIWFLFLTVADRGLGEDLYIKMNSRGKPLTRFEVIKAALEGALEPVLTKERLDHFKTRIDGEWTDLFWEYERRSGGDLNVDSELERYLTFLMDVAEWRQGRATRDLPLEDRARDALIGETGSQEMRNLDFLFDAFDTWNFGATLEADRVLPSDVFEAHFGPFGEGSLRVPLLTAQNSDLFGACIAGYGTDHFSLSDALLLFAVLLARQNENAITAEQLARRLRSLRNVAESAFLDRKRLPDMISAVEQLIVDGRLDGAAGFNAEWMRDEERKWAWLDTHPEQAEPLHLLEDLTLLRGRLLAFDLDVDRLPARARALSLVSDRTLRDAFGAALLTKGDYSRRIDERRRQLGSSIKDDSWRDLLTTPSLESATSIRTALADLLDDVDERVSRGGEPAAVLTAICEDWLSARDPADGFDWRFYLVRYRTARSSQGEGYYHGERYDVTKGGFTLGRLRKLHGFNYQSRFTDAILAAVWDELHNAMPDVAVEQLVEEPSWWHRDDPGMRLKRSQIEIRNLDEGFEIVVPYGSYAEADVILASVEDVTGRLLRVPGVDEGGRWSDSQDRIQIGVGLVRTLLAAGL